MLDTAEEGEETACCAATSGRGVVVDEHAPSARTDVPRSTGIFMIFYLRNCNGNDNASVVDVGRQGTRALCLRYLEDAKTHQVQVALQDAMVDRNADLVHRRLPCLLILGRRLRSTLPNSNSNHSLRCIRHSLSRHNQPRTR